MTKRIFVCYRREDKAGWAGRVHDKLEDHFDSESIFMDVETLRPGLNFIDEIDSAVSEIDVLIVVIGPSWLTIEDDAGNRRLDNPQDFVRREIATALEQEKLVIPVLVANAQMPKDTDLPEDLKELARRQCVELRHTHFRQDAEHLIEHLVKVIGESDRAGIQEDHHAIRPKAPSEKFDIRSSEFIDTIERFIQKEKTLAPEAKKARLDFYLEYIDRLQEQNTDDRLGDQKRLNLQYLTSYGVEIVQLKQMLCEVGLYSGSGKDFPDDLVYAIKAYQKSKGLKAVDGIFGPETFHTLITQLALRDASAEQEE